MPFRFPLPTQQSVAPRRAAVTEHLRRAAARGEAGVAILRLIIAGLVFLQLVLLHLLVPEQVARPAFWVVSLACVIAWAWSVRTLRTIKAGTLRLRRLLFSVSVDVLVIALSLFAVVGWPHAGYRGMIHYPGLPVFWVVSIAAGLRLSRKASLFASALSLLAQVGLLALDQFWNATLTRVDGPPIAMVAISWAGSAVLGYLVASRTKRLVYEGADAALSAERARQRLGVYVSEEVATAALSATHLATGGRRQKVAVLFSDLRGFTRYAEHRAPERLISELNAYLDAMVRIVQGQGGFVDKYIGDSMMVLFGFPEEEGPHAARAVRTAIEMQRALHAHNLERASRGEPDLAHGIGVHYGEAVLGHVGNQDRMQFTAIGDSVNLASRLQSATKELGVSLVCSSDVVEELRRCPDGLDPNQLSSLGRIEVRGRAGDLEVFTVVDPGAPASSPPRS